jgi:hypothetical protein
LLHPTLPPFASQRDKGIQYIISSRSRAWRHESALASRRSALFCIHTPCLLRLVSNALETLFRRSCTFAAAEMDLELQEALHAWQRQSEGKQVH